MTESRYRTPELDDVILTRIASGEPLRTICQDPGMPSEALVRRWALAEPDGFGARYRAARETAAEAWDEKAEAVLLEARDRDEISRAKELAHHYRWRASKAAPRAYGDRVEVEHSGNVAVAALLGEARARFALLEPVAPVALPGPAAADEGA